ncbi:MAG: hypothetical protein AB1630_07455 [bacterium]
MLLIDIPVGLISGQLIADAGRDILHTKRGYSFLKTISILFAFLFITPIVIYFYLGWPAWETNYFFKEIDNIKNNPWLALISGISIVSMTLIPTLLGLFSGRYLITRGKRSLLKASYISLGILILIIVFFSRNQTFNVSANWVDWQSGNTFSFFENPFFIFWLILTIIFWGSLFILYIWIRKKSKDVSFI